MKQLHKLSIAFLFFCISSSLFSQAVKYSNEFLAIGVGARALGMANSTVATVNDATSGYWNPAGLLYQRSNLQVALMHSEYFAGIAKYDFIGGSKRVDSNSVVGITFIRFGVDNIPNTTELIDANGNVDYSRLKSFNAVDAAECRVKPHCAIGRIEANIHAIAVKGIGGYFSIGKHLKLRRSCLKILNITGAYDMHRIFSHDDNIARNIMAIRVFKRPYFTQLHI